LERRASCAWAVLPCLLAGLVLANPSRAADEIHWTLTGPTSVTFDWRGSETSIRYGLTNSYGLSASAQTPTPLPYSSSGPFKEARITSLLPATLYHYSIGTGPDHTFRTMPVVGSTFKVMVEGDIGDTTNYARVGAVQTLVAREAPAFVLMVGDLTYGNDHGQSCVDIHFNNVMKWSQDAAYMPAWGNHEWDSSGDNFNNYKGRFDFPNPQTSPGAPSAGCCGEDWYWFDCANVRFIAYPEPFSGAWSDWNTKAKAVMDAAQANPAIRYIVTMGHRPAYSSGHHPGDSTLKGYIDGLGTGHSKYVLNLNGHSHDYERSFPQHGVIHITAGTGGSTLEEDGTCLWLGGCTKPSWCAFRAMHHGVLQLTFTPTGILGEAVCGPAGDTGSNKNDITCTSGNVFDSFTIGNPSIVEVAPPAPVAARFAIESVVPNPTSGAPHVVYALVSWAPARLEMLDVAGRQVLARDLGSPGPGRHEAQLGADPAPVPGVYWVRLSQAGRDVSHRIVFVR
jgi:calcineurin-like phosphoesterase family protein